MGAVRDSVRPFEMLLLGVLLAVSTTAGAADLDAKREKIREQSAEVLQHLYTTVPGSREVVSEAAGYATFRKLGIKIGVAGGGGGRGLAVDKAGKQTFMAYAEVSAGLGLGIKTFDLIFVFDTKEAMAAFIEKGWEYHGEASASAKRGEEGKSISEAQSVSPGVSVYQLTSTGLEAQLTIKGTKYFKDPRLN
jgi:lipid-binding SYLF domain-containing protein